MIGIRNIGVHIPAERIDNLDKPQYTDITEAFLETRTGIRCTARKPDEVRASDLCVLAARDLLEREPGLKKEAVDFVTVCTQNGDFPIPHTAALVQHKLGLPATCAAFDISLGCSGYVYSLLAARSFMEANGLRCGLVFTCDPYSEVLAAGDKDTDLIFGDAAAVTLLTEDAVLAIGRGVFNTDGSAFDQLIKRKDQPLFMNGRGVYNFVMRNVPDNVRRCLEANGTAAEAVDLFLLHQGSKYIVDSLVQRLGLPKDKVPFAIREYGNTVSSTLPILLQPYLADPAQRTFLLCGFGVGLSAAGTMLFRRDAQ